MSKYILSELGERIIHCILMNIQENEREDTRFIIESLLAANGTDASFNRLAMPICMAALPKKRPKDLIDMITFSDKLTEYVEKNKYRLDEVVSKYGYYSSGTGVSEETAKFMAILADEFIETV